MITLDRTDECCGFGGTFCVVEEAVSVKMGKDRVADHEKNKVEAGNTFTEYRMVEVKKGVSASGFTEIKLPYGFNTSGVKVVTRGAYSLLSAKKNAGEMAC